MVLAVVLTAFSVLQAYASASAPELVDMRTESAKFYPAEGGMTTGVFYTAPIHYRDTQGKWQETDLNMVDLAGVSDDDDSLKRFRIGSGQAKGAINAELGTVEDGQGDLKLSKTQFQSGVIRHRTGFLAPRNANGYWVVALGDKERIAFKASGTRPSSGRRQKNMVTFDDAWEGATLQYKAGYTALKEDIVLSSANAPLQYEFKLKSYGLTPKKNADGLLDFVDESGQVKASVCAPFMADAAGEFTTKVDLNVVLSGKSASLKITIDKEWLQDPKRVFPVKIDPTISTRTDVGDASMSEYHGNTALGTTELEFLDIGLWKNLFVHSRNWLLFKFDLRSLPTNTYVQDASMSMYCFHTENNAFNYMDYFTASTTVFTNSWNESTVTWNNSGVSTSQPADSKATYLPNTENVFWTKPVETSLVRDLLQYPTHSVLMYAYYDGHEGFIRRFHSKEAATTADKLPQLRVTFSHVPVVSNIQQGYVAPANPDLAALGFKDKLRYAVSWSTSFPYVSGYTGTNFACSGKVQLTNQVQSSRTFSSTDVGGTSHSVNLLNTSQSAQLVPFSTYSASLSSWCVASGHTCYDSANSATYKTASLVSFDTNLSFSTFNWAANPSTGVSSWGWSPLAQGHTLNPENVGCVTDFRYATDTDARSQVEYWKEGDSQNITTAVEGATDGFRHFLSLSGLKWGATYQYRVITRFPWDTSNSYQIISATGTIRHPYSGPNASIVRPTNAIQVEWATTDPNVSGFAVTYSTAGEADRTFPLGKDARTHTLTNPGYDRMYTVQITASDSKGHQSASEKVTVYTMPEPATLYTPSSATGISGTLSDGYRTTLLLSQSATQWYQIKRYRQEGINYVLDKSTVQMTKASMIPGPGYTLADGTIVPTFSFGEPVDWVHEKHATYQYEVITANLNPAADTVTTSWGGIVVNNNPPSLTTTPSGGTALKSAGTIELAASASDADEDTLMYKFEIIRNGESAAAYYTDWIVEKTHTFSSVPDGEYTWKVSVKDGWVEIPSVSTGTVSVNSAASQVSFRINNGQAATTSSLVNLTGITYTGSVGQLMARNDSDEWQEITGQPSEISGWQLPGGEGRHTVSMKVSSSHGVEGSEYIQEIIVDNGAPGKPVVSAKGQVGAVKFTWPKPEDYLAGALVPGSGVSHFDLERWDGQQWQALASVPATGSDSYEYVVTAPGSNTPVTVRVKAVDLAGNASDWSDDKTGYSLASSGSLTLANGFDELGTFIKVTPQSVAGAVSYAIERDGAVVSNGSAPFFDRAIAPHATYQYRVLTYNSASEYTESDYSAITANNPPVFDNTTAAPAGSPGHEFSNASALSVTASDPDGDNPALTYYLSSDGGTFAPLAGGTLSGLVEGQQYWWKAVAQDGFGGQSESAVFTFRVDTIAPLIARDNVSTQYAPEQVVTVTASDDGSGVKRILYRWNADAWTETQGSSVTLRAPYQGQNVLAVKVEDQAGNIAQNGEGWVYLVDGQPPVITGGKLHLPGSGTLYSSTSSVAASWAVTSTSAVVDYQYKFNCEGQTTELEFVSAPVSGTSGSFTGTFIQGKTYTLVLRALNQAGVWSAPVSLGSFVYDATAPVPSGPITLSGGQSGPGGYYASGMAALNASVSFADAESGVSSPQFGFQPLGSNDTLWYDNWALLQAAHPAPETPFVVMARVTNGANLVGQLSSATVIVDTTAPTLSVTDDGATTASFNRMTFAVSASDIQSGVTSLKYKLGTTPGGDDVSATFAGAENGWVAMPAFQGTRELAVEFPLSAGTTYYVTVQASNPLGLVTTAQTDGITAEVFNPDQPVVTDDGRFTSSSTRLHARVEIYSSKGVTGYSYRVRSKDGQYQSAWIEMTSSLRNVEIEIHDLTLADGTEYMIEAIAHYPEGDSPVGCSNGIVVDTTPPVVQLGVPSYAPPTGISVVLEGSDPESTASFSLAVGTEPGGSDLSNGWISLRAVDGLQNLIRVDGVLVPGLDLQHDQFYYISVKAENGAGAAKVVEGKAVRIDGTPPEAFVVIDGGEYTRETSVTVRYPWAAGDPDSGIAIYQVALTTSLQLSAAQEWQSVSPNDLQTVLALPAENGAKYFVAVKAVNGAGLETICWSDGIIFDENAPAMLQVQDSGDYTRISTALDVTLNATDDISGIDHFRLNVTGTADTPIDANGGDLPKNVSISPVTLTEGQIYSVSAQAIDGAGNVSLAGMSDGIMVASQIPSMTGIYTSTRFVKCGLPMEVWWKPATSTAPVSRYEYAVIPSAQEIPGTADWVAAGPDCRVSITPSGFAHGQKVRVCVRAIDRAGNVMDGFVWAEVEIDETDPVVTAFTSSSEFASRSTTVTLTAEEDKSGITQVLFAVGTFPGGTNVTNGWLKGSTTFSFAGLPLIGGKMYYPSVMVRNGAGVWSAVAKGSGLVADITPPGLPIVQAPAAINKSTEVAGIHWEGQDAESGITGYRWEIKEVTTGTVLSGSSLIPTPDTAVTFAITGLSLTEGQSYQVGVAVKNGAGEWSAMGYSSPIRVDLTAPSVQFLESQPIVSNGGTVPVRWSSSEAGTATLVLQAPNGTSTETTMTVTGNAENVFNFVSTVDGIYTLKVTVVDTAGNTADATLSMRKNIIPVVTLGPDFAMRKGESHQFIAAVVDQDETIGHTFYWSFGDGAISTEVQPEHQFTQTGMYTVTVTVTDSDLGQASKSVTVSVTNTSGGTLLTDETWTNPMMITGDVIVPAGKKLTISPSTQVVFAGNYGIFVYGTILVQGSPEGRVTLKAFDTLGVWKGIRLDGAVGSSIAGADFSHATTGIEVKNCGAVISDCSLTDCTTGVRFDGATQATATGLRVSSGSTGVVGVVALNSSVMLSNSTFESLQQFAIQVSGGTPILSAITVTGGRVGISSLNCPLVLNSSTFQGVEYGIHVYGGTPTIDGCQFIDCSFYGIKEDAGGNPVVTNCTFTHTADSAYVGDYYDQELTILAPDELNTLPGNSGNH